MILKPRSGTIRMPPEKDTLTYPPPKAEGGKARKAQILARVYYIERFINVKGNKVYYCRIMDRVKWLYDDHEELRFTYYYCNQKNLKKEPNPSDKVWVYGQGAGHMKPNTLLRVLKKAKYSPYYGTFSPLLNKLKIV